MTLFVDVKCQFTANTHMTQNRKEVVNTDARLKFKNTIVKRVRSVQWPEDDRYCSLIPPGVLRSESVSELLQSLQY